MNILFITSSRIGDAVLSSGLLSYISQTWPEAKVTIACGPLATSLFDGYPQLVRIIPLRKEKHHGHWRKMWMQVAGQRWDIVIDLRNTVASRLVRAKKRYVFGGHIRKNQHKVRQMAAVMSLDEVPAPHLWFSEEQQKHAEKLIPEGGPVLAVAPTANWLAKTWPADHFVKVVGWAVGKDGPMAGARAAIFAAPGEEEGARQVLASLPEKQQIDVIAKTDPGTAAACLARCDTFIGNDSGLMHCAAAVGIKVLGLFGPSYPEIYGPWGAHCEYVATPKSFDELINYPGYDPKTAPCLMEGLEVDVVKEGLERLLQDKRFT